MWQSHRSFVALLSTVTLLSCAGNGRPPVSFDTTDTPAPTDLQPSTPETRAADNNALPAPEFLCASCTAHEECGGTEDLCLALDAFGGFCGVHCADHQCPTDYACEQVALAAEGVVGIPWQCVPVTGTCCTPAREDTAAECHRTNDWGTCPGTRICLAETGWTSCSATIPKEDLCNGLDDDCDGTTDAGFDDLDLDGLADCIDEDLDNDGVDDDEDNCLELFNPDQDDLDEDGQGDPCDQDLDGDGWPDWQDCDPWNDQIYPGADEVEDGQDNNCDGDIDEDPGETGPCGPDCFGMSSGPNGAADFDLDQEAVAGIEEDEKGYLVLDRGALTYTSIWIANSGEGTVSRLDTDTGQEIGRYQVCTDPSRTAVDLVGDVWVACRGDGGVAKITLVQDNCVDLNGDGLIQTSHDADDDGVISAGEMLPFGQDECVRFIVHPGGMMQRAAGVDAANHAWIGSWYDMKLLRLAPDDGALVQEIEIPAQPYGLVIDGSGIIWVSGRGGNQLVRVDPVTEDVQTLIPPGNIVIGMFEPYGITLDSLGNVWLANCCGPDLLYRYTPSTQQWTVCQTKHRPRGLVGHSNGRIYVALDEDNTVAVLDAATMSPINFLDIGNGRYPIGMAVDSAGQVWTVNQQGWSATRIDPDTNQITGEFPVGVSPYTYSDMTGYVLYTFTAPQGAYVQTFCAPTGTSLQWSQLNADMVLPTGTEIHVRVRSAPDQESLTAASWLEPFDSFPGEALPLDLLQIPDLIHACLQAEFVLIPNEDNNSPMLKGISAQYLLTP